MAEMNSMIQPASGLEPISASGVEPAQKNESIQARGPPEHTHEEPPEPSQTPDPKQEPVPSQEIKLIHDQTVAQIPPPESTQGSLQPKLPLQHLFQDNRRSEFKAICVPLYGASINGDWNAALRILESPNQDKGLLVQCSITDHCETMLHVAASAQSTDFVRNLVDIMQERDEDLLYINKNGNTALCLAAITGNVEIAKIMVDRKRELLTIRNAKGMLPLCIAALYGKLDMVTYLYGQMQPGEWIDKHDKWVYLKCVETDLYVIARKMLQDHPELANSSMTQSVLGVLARKPSAFSETKQQVMRRIINSICCCKVKPVANTSEAMQLLTDILTSVEEKPMKEIHDILRGPETRIHGMKTYPSRVLFVAAEMGNTEFIVKLIREYPDLIWKTNDNNQSIFHVAVSHRHESIYNLLYEIGSMKDLIVVLKDKDGNNMLHLVGKIANKPQLQHVSGATFQMQWELLWYKEIESMIPPSYREKKNQSGQTPHELFTETHKDLVMEGEKWMRGTASKCMLVATLLATIVFGVAYTIPGGYSEKNGFPNFLHNGPFIVFVILDAVSLILSSTSILVFLSILTSRYTQDDFIESLPKKLIVGLSMLFLSIVTMMIAFSVSFYVIYRHNFIIVASFISLFALIPIFAYAQLHYPLLVDVVRSTYGSRYLFKPKQRMLYYQNPRV